MTPVEFFSIREKLFPTFASGIGTVALAHEQPQQSKFNAKVRVTEHPVKKQLALTLYRAASESPEETVSVPFASARPSRHCPQRGRKVTLPGLCPYETMVVLEGLGKSREPGYEGEGKRALALTATHPERKRGFRFLRQHKHSSSRRQSDLVYSTVNFKAKSNIVSSLKTSDLQMTGFICALWQ
ncbi:hypothetical protein MJT46_011783 [Ovis ammon polii x Ovis aries]|nr:hypothetical protein MJT46_011783 [Ovis ammon polii x Ovis aries]